MSYLRPASCAQRSTSAVACVAEDLPTALEEDPIERAVDSESDRRVSVDLVRVLYISLTSLKLFAPSIDSTIDLFFEEVDVLILKKLINIKKLCVEQIEIC